jgi:hypothetical protein
MKLYKNRWLLVFTFITVLFTSCKKDIIEPALTVSDSFECGSIGEFRQVSETECELYIADDNNNPDLPDNWRSWWYVSLDNLMPDKPTLLTIKNSGWPFYYLPVYSYDQTEWLQFTEEEITQNTNNDLIIRKQFGQKKVWIVRFYPYTFTDLKSYLDGIKSSRYIDINVPGYSQEGNPIYLLKITDPTIPNSGKKRIFIHARTHAAEIPSSFLIEGMINYLISGTPEATELLSEFEFYIFPMQNVDGVIAGNYRSTPKSENLEMMWYYDSLNPLNLTSDAPPEVTVIEQTAVKLMSDGGPAISIALNLHASNSEPDIRPFFYPHFGTESQGYSSVEASLWGKQLSFITHVTAHYGESMIEPIPEEGGGSFAGKTYPESWWWVNYKDKVMAMTLEMTYGRAGYSPRWINPDDLRDFGSSLVKGIRDYSIDTPVPALINLKAKWDSRCMNLKYPELYPPAARDELKE